MSTGASKVVIQEWDFSTRVPSFPGLYAAIALPARKGIPDYGVLTTSETQLLQLFTPDETVSVGDDLAIYDALAFLAKSNKLWVSRAAVNPLYGGVFLTQSLPLESIKATVNEALFSLVLRQVTPLEKKEAESFWQVVSIGDRVRLATDVGGSLPVGLKTNRDYYLIKYDSQNFQLRLANTIEDAYTNKYIEFTDGGTGSVTITLPESASNGSLEFGLSDPNTYQLNSSDGKMVGFTSEFVVDVNNSEFSVPEAFWDTTNTGNPCKLQAANLGLGDFPEVAVGAPLNATSTYYIIKQAKTSTGATKVRLARSASEALALKGIDLLTTGTPGLSIILSNRSTTTTVEIDPVIDSMAVSPAFWDTVRGGDKVRFVDSPGMGTILPDIVTGAPLNFASSYFVIKGVSGTLQISMTSGGTAINFSTTGTNITLEAVDKSTVADASIDLSDDVISVSETSWENMETGHRAKVSSTGRLPGGLSDTAEYYVFKEATPGKLALCRTLQEAKLGIPVDLTDPGEGTHLIRDANNTLLPGLKQKVLLIYNSTPCEEQVWVQTLHYPYGDPITWTDNDRIAAETVKEPGCFMVWVYKKNSSGEYFQAESPMLMSREEGKRDGYGTNIYCEEVSKRSNFIRIKDNKSVHPSILPKDQGELLRLTHGSNGYQVTDSAMMRAISVFSSRRDTPLTLILDGGWSTPAYQKTIIGICEKRQDCVGLLSVPLSAQLSADYLNAIRSYRKDILNANTSYAALYAPHLKIADKFNDRNILVSPTGYVAGCICDNETNYELWYAPAGPKYGVLNVLDVARRFSEGELDDLYNSGINPIDFYPGRGIRIWGQKTLLTRASALDRLNVRLMLIVIEPAIAEFLENFLFEINDEITRMLVSSGITSYMEGIKARRGVYDYQIKCDAENNTPETIDANELHVWLYVKPSKVVEYIFFKVIITRTNASFTLVG